jgi:hypothetical protein
MSSVSPRRKEKGQRMSGTMVGMSDNEPVAWAVWSPTFGYAFGDAAIFKRNELAVEMCVMNGYGVDDIVPLYRKPLLTDLEQKAIRRAAAVANEFHDSRLQAALGGLLERLT